MVSQCRSQWGDIAFTQQWKPVSRTGEELSVTSDFAFFQQFQSISPLMQCQLECVLTHHELFGNGEVFTHSHPSTPPL